MSKRDEGRLRLKCCWGSLSPLSMEEGWTGPSGLEMLAADQDPVASVTPCFLFPKLLALISLLAALCSSSLAALSSAKESYSEVWVHLLKLCAGASGSVTLQKETSLRETLSLLRKGQQTRKTNYQKYCLQKHFLTWVCFWYRPVGWLLVRAMPPVLSQLCQWPANLLLLCDLTWPPCTKDEQQFLTEANSICMVPVLSEKHICCRSYLIYIYLIYIHLLAPLGFDLRTIWRGW